MNDLTPMQRAQELLSQMSLEEKLYQLSAQMIYSVGVDYEEIRQHKEGNYRNPGHFMHYDRPEPVGAAQVAERIRRFFARKPGASSTGENRVLFCWFISAPSSPLRARLRIFPGPLRLFFL